MEELPENVSAVSRLSTFLKRPMITILLVGIIIRAVLIPLLTYNYDIAFWATTIQHAQSNNGLYNLEGYFYTPVWGYMLSFLGLIGNFVFGISSYGTMADGLLASLGADWEFYGVMTVSPEFSILVKSFLSVFDVICAYLIYTIVKRFGYSDRKATMAFGLWFLCPIVIYTSAVHGTFDNISVSFLLLSFLLAMDRKYMLAGASFSIAALTKFFPAYLAFMLLAYVLRTNNERNSKAKAILSVAAGVLIAAFLILIPQIMTGYASEAFGFVFDRVSSIQNDADSLWDFIATNGMLIVLLLQPLAFALLGVMAYKAYKAEESKFNETFMLMFLLSATAIFLWTPAPTYLLLTIPFLIFVVVTAESESQKRYIIPLILLFVSTTLYSLTMHSFSILFQSSVYMELVSAETILNGIEWMSHIISAGLTRQTALNLVMGALETLAIYSVFLVYIINHITSKKRRSDCVGQ